MISAITELCGEIPAVYYYVASILLNNIYFILVWQVK